MRTILTLVAVVGLSSVLVAADQPTDPAWDIKDFKAAKPEDKQDTESVPAPKGAVVLFDGKDLSGWTKKDGKGEATWKLVELTKEPKTAADRAMEVKGGDIISKEKFDGSFKLHVEFRVPYMPKASGQGRGNSGVYVQGRYEVQVLDSYGLNSQDNDCGGIYKVAKPLVNACKAPAVWQSYDIEFTSPKFDGKKKVEPAVITVYHNGQKIHDKVKINVDVTTSGLTSDPATPGPVLLQDHGNPVQYRNIWVLKSDK